MLKRFFILLLLIPFILSGKPPEINSVVAQKKMREMMQSHATHKAWTKELVKRTYINFLEELDPSKTYFIKSDIDGWLEPDDSLLNRTLQDFEQCNFCQFELMYHKMLEAIARRRALEEKINLDDLPKKVDSKKFKDLKWAESEEELLERLKDVKGLQVETSVKINEEEREKSLQRIAKRRRYYEQELMTNDPVERQQLILTNVLKAFAGALDSHTAYFTPDEAKQFLISVQQRLFGIGAQLRDDINGFSVVKIVEGGPADVGGKLKVKDLIIAVDGEPVVGMNIIDAVSLIRGEKETPVVLTVIRETEDEEEETLDIEVVRNEVVLKETRYESSFEPFGDGVIAYLRLYSFYQDPGHSSAADLRKAFEEIQKEHKVLGVVFDLRNNSGGMLTQAVEVTGLFITKGIVVSIKDEEGNIQHLRDVDGKMMWDGPLVVLVNRISASASEIVAQTLQDYGRAIVLGDEHSYGKGSFQTFTLNAIDTSKVNPEGEYKVTRGRYYTVSGKTPQLVGVESDIVLPGPLSESEIGEKYGKFPLGTDTISPNFDDDLSDIPFTQRAKISALYRFNLQKKLDTYDKFLPVLSKNAEKRIESNKNYQKMLEEIKVKEIDFEEEEKSEYGQNDLQLIEAMNVMKDLILMEKVEELVEEPAKAA